MTLLRVSWRPPSGEPTVYGYRLHAKPLPPCPATLGAHKRYVEVPCPDELVNPLVLEQYAPQIMIFALTPHGEMRVPVKAEFVERT